MSVDISIDIGARLGTSAGGLSRETADKIRELITGIRDDRGPGRIRRRPPHPCAPAPVGAPYHRTGTRRP